MDLKTLLQKHAKPGQQPGTDGAHQQPAGERTTAGEQERRCPDDPSPAQTEGSPPDNVSPDGHTDEPGGGGNATQGVCPGPTNEAVGHERVGAAVPLKQWPAKHLVVDFETYFDRDYSLKKLTVPEYVHDARFHVHGMAIRWPDGRSEFRTDVEKALSEISERFGPNWQQVVTVAFNAQFDGYILSRVYGIRPAFWIDPMAMARQVLPGLRSYSLASLAEEIGLPPKGKELEEVIGVRSPDPQQMAALRRYAINDVEITHALLEKLYPELSRSEVEFRLIDQCIRLFTERCFAVDPHEAHALKGEIASQTRIACQKAGCDLETVSSDTKFTETLRKALKATGRDVPTKPDRNGEPILAFAQEDPAYRQLQEDADPKVRALAQARALVQSVPAHHQRVERIESIARGTGGVLPVPLRYHAAHTGRYGGSGGINLQNLPKRTGGPAAGICNLLSTEAGRMLVGADAAQIEARILATIAGEEKLVAAFRGGRDVYSEFASRVFRETVRKPTEGDSAEMAERMKALRHIGKQSILGLGYGMGPATFEQKLLTDPDARPLFESGELDTDRIKQIVYAEYRRGYASIPALWRGLEDAFRDAVLRATGNCRGVEFTRVDGAVHVRLPSGRTLRYPEATIGGDDELLYRGSKKLWGGKLAENIVQALARDFICEVMLKAEEAGYEVLLQVHDEVVLQVPEEKAEEARGFLLRSLRTAPEWMPALPLNAETWARPHYGEKG